MNYRFPNPSFEIHQIQEYCTVQTSSPETGIQIGLCKKSLKIFSEEKFSQQMLLCSDKWRVMAQKKVWICDQSDASIQVTWPDLTNQRPVFARMGKWVLTSQETVIICHPHVINCHPNDIVMSSQVRVMSCYYQHITFWYLVSIRYCLYAKYA